MQVLHTHTQHEISKRQERECGNEFTMLIVLQSLLEVSKVPVLVGAGNGTHALDISQICIFESKFDREKRINIFWLLISNE